MTDSGEGAGKSGSGGSARRRVPRVVKLSNEDVNHAATRGSKLMAIAWWLARTDSARHRVTMFRLYSSTVRPPKRPK